MKELPNEIESLKTLILEEQLKAEVVKLRGRLGLNSGNSHTNNDG